MWKRIDSFRSDLQKARDELLVLQEQIKFMPSRDLLDKHMRDMEEKLGKRLDDLGIQIREMLMASK